MSFEIRFKTNYVGYATNSKLDEIITVTEKKSGKSLTLEQEWIDLNKTNNFLGIGTIIVQDTVNYKLFRCYRSDFVGLIQKFGLSEEEINRMIEFSFFSRAPENNNGGFNRNSQKQIIPEEIHYVTLGNSSSEVIGRTDLEKEKNVLASFLFEKHFAMLIMMKKIPPQEIPKGFQTLGEKLSEFHQLPPKDLTCFLIMDEVFLYKKGKHCYSTGNVEMCAILEKWFNSCINGVSGEDMTKMQNDFLNNYELKIVREEKFKIFETPSKRALLPPTAPLDNEEEDCDVKESPLFSTTSIISDYAPVAQQEFLDFLFRQDIDDLRRYGAVDILSSKSNSFSIKNCMTLAYGTSLKELKKNLILDEIYLYMTKSEHAYSKMDLGMQAFLERFHLELLIEYYLPDCRELTEEQCYQNFKDNYKIKLRRI